MIKNRSRADISVSVLEYVHPHERCIRRRVAPSLGSELERFDQQTQKRRRLIKDSFREYGNDAHSSHSIKRGCALVYTKYRAVGLAWSHSCTI